MTMMLYGYCLYVFLLTTVDRQVVRTEITIMIERWNGQVVEMDPPNLIFGLELW
jgi:hypothetical protein